MKQYPLLQQYFGFPSFRSGQEEAVKHILRGRDTLVIMPTGSGKSLIYQYAALALRERSKTRASLTLVISPLIALMKDQVDSLQTLGIAATYINSTVAPSDQRQRINAMQRGDYQLVYVAPERLRQSSFMAVLQNIEIQLFAIDEAHCISSWGHDFRPDYRRIAQARRELGLPLTVALTATATALVQDDIVELLGIPEAPRVVTGFNRTNLSFEVLYASGTHAKLQELASLLQKQFNAAPGSAQNDGACIIYATTRKEAEEIASFVGQNLSLSCACYHAGMAAAQRGRIQDAFCSGNLGIVVATNAFGMGIDRQDVRLVIHYNLPGTLEAYYQEAGRAGRDGLPARAILLFSPQDRSLQSFFIRQNSISAEQLHQLFRHLQALPTTIEAGMEPTGSGSARLCRPIEQKSLAQSLGWGRDSAKLRMALAHLEKAGILSDVEFRSLEGEEGALSLVPRGWDAAAASASTRQLEEYSSHRRQQLEQMSYYAQADACRRQILLSYFSDHSKVLQLSAERCCDYCFRQGLRQQLRSQNATTGLEQLSRAERAALIVLDSVRQLDQSGIRVGRQRIVQLLSGSRSQKMGEAFRAQRYYGRLAALAQKQIEAAINELLQGAYLQHRSLESSDATIIALSTQGREAIEFREAIRLRAFEAVDSHSTTSEGKTSKSFSKVSAGSSTAAETLKLLRQGLAPEQVAKQRGLHPQTISTHIGNLIEQGELNLADYVSQELRQLIEECLCRFEKQGQGLSRLKPIKEQLPKEVSYDQIKFVLGAWRGAQNTD